MPPWGLLEMEERVWIEREPHKLLHIERIVHHPLVTRWGLTLS